MGLPEGHPEKEGVLVDISNLVHEIKLRIEQKNKGVQASTVIATDAVESTTAAAANLSVSGDAATQKTEDAGV